MVLNAKVALGTTSSDQADPCRPTRFEDDVMGPPGVVWPGQCQWLVRGVNVQMAIYGICSGVFGNDDKPKGVADREAPECALAPRRLRWVIADHSPNILKIHGPESRTVFIWYVVKILRCFGLFCSALHGQISCTPPESNPKHQGSHPAVRSPITYQKWSGT